MVDILMYLFCFKNCDTHDTGFVCHHHTRVNLYSTTVSDNLIKMFGNQGQQFTSLLLLGNQLTFCMLDMLVLAWSYHTSSRNVGEQTAWLSLTSGLIKKDTYCLIKLYVSTMIKHNISIITRVDEQSTSMKWYQYKSWLIQDV